MSFFDDIEQLVLQKYQIKASERSKLEKLFKAYSNPSTENTHLNDPQAAAAYLLSRGRTIAHIIHQLIEDNFSFFENVRSIVDFGGGPGTFFYATEELEIDSYINIERSSAFLKVFQAVASSYSQNIAHKVNLQSSSVDYLSSPFVSKADLAVFSYTLCENANFDKVLMNLNDDIHRIFIIEPGTPHGFNTILKARKILEEKGYFTVAPCTASVDSCPFEAVSDDWCHFIKRVNRSRIQKFLKNGQKSYEDEKYMYLLVSRDGSDHSFDKSAFKKRIIAKPRIEKHKIQVKICDDKNPQKEIIKKNQLEEYRLAKKSQRGDLL